MTRFYLAAACIAMTQTRLYRVPSWPNSVNGNCSDLDDHFADPACTSKP